MSRSMRGKVVPLREGDVVDQDGNRNVAEGTELVQPSELLGEFGVLRTLPGLHRLERHGLLEKDLA